MSILDDPPLPPIEKLHREAALIDLRCELREAEVRAECLRWWAANPQRYLSLCKAQGARLLVVSRPA